ncbi:tetratricopeptide repeat protein [Streptomyces beihaiensis]|uniref:Tetratricopeptide repeat protein n=1 Tax=Streptomyces beihaiensis TaxID=2984495 RepID=A0ABT3TZ70_9ACTN|nr:tetratricopeptide repeat protein [Streptomyces beihaiensis]MCX3061360.1 tetratricopeptide repeat protein [Streptomyces beihaiensis]
MEQATPRHHWLCGGSRDDRAAVLPSLALPQALEDPVDAHRRLRGPYTAAGTLVRALTPAVLPRDSELVRRHDIEILSVAPELKEQVPNSRETLTSMALPAERTRYYARLRTKRIANGLVEFVRDAWDDDAPRSLVIENAEHADASDQEFLAALLRRVDPARLTVVVCTGAARQPGAQLAAALAQHCSPTEVPHGAAEAAQAGTGTAGTGTAETTTAEADPAAAAWDFVRSECLDDGPGATGRAAYEALTDAQRAALHDRRAAELTAANEFTLRLGAVPYHLERGADPLGTAVPALWEAADHCMVNGFYDAVIELAQRGHLLIEGTDDIRLWWKFGRPLGLALSLLDRTQEAERVYEQARILFTSPQEQMECVYSIAMLYTRHHPMELRDDRKAKALLNGAIATASLLEGRVERAFKSAFYKNGRALVEVHLGDLREGLRLVNECIEDLDRKLTPDEHRLHRSVLKNNRARVCIGLGRFDDALADYAVVIEQDPNHAEHYLERGDILRRLGRDEEALADYTRALELSPPFPEIYYNRGDLRLADGDVKGAMEDFSYVIELEPEFLEAYINRAGLHLELGDPDAALRDAETGLRLAPDCAHLHAVVGHVLAEREDHAGAEAAYDRALNADPALVSALCGRATARYETGRRQAALEDLSRAVELEPDDPALLYNRAFLRRETGAVKDALDDLELASTLAPDDEEIAAALTDCRHAAAAA